MCVLCDNHYYKIIYRNIGYTGIIYIDMTSNRTPKYI